MNAHIHVQDIFSDKFEIELTEPQNGFHLKELLFQSYGRNANINVYWFSGIS
jgi:hypothetical protein